MREERGEVLGEVGAPVDGVEDVEEVGVEGVIYEGGGEEGDGFVDVFCAGEWLLVWSSFVLVYGVGWCIVVVL